MALVARDAEALAGVASDIGGSAVVVPCDLTDGAGVEQMISSVREAFGGAPDIIVNNAGVFELVQIEQMPREVFLQSLQTNLIAPFMVIRAFAHDMRERGSGHIVSVGSVADRSVMAENGAYAPAKYGLRAMHEVLRLELRGSGVRATLVSPGAVDTALWDDLLSTESHTGSLPMRSLPTRSLPMRSLPTRDAMLSTDAVAAAILYAVTQPASVNVDELRLSRS